MDILTMLAQAKVNDINGVALGNVQGIHFVAGKIVLTLDLDLMRFIEEDDEEDEDDPDDGEKDEIPEHDASRLGAPKLVVADGRMKEAVGDKV
jgi:hypothetical protein